MTLPTIEMNELDEALTDCVTRYWIYGYRGACIKTGIGLATNR